MAVSLKKRAYSHIRSKILLGQFLPGDRISHRELAREVGVSYTPIREAINQLAEEGFVECRSRQGTFITTLSADDVAEVSEVRIGIEKHIMERLAGNVHADTLAEVRELNQQLRCLVAEFEETKGRLWVVEQARPWIRYDGAIHLTLLCESGNRRAIKVIREMQLMGIISGYCDQAPSLEGLLFSINTHERLFDALEQGDGETASKVVQHHLASAYRDAAEATKRGNMGKVEGWHSAVQEFVPSLAFRMKNLGLD